PSAAQKRSGIISWRAAFRRNESRPSVSVDRDRLQTADPPRVASTAHALTSCFSRPPLGPADRVSAAGESACPPAAERFELPCTRHGRLRKQLSKLDSSFCDSRVFFGRSTQGELMPRKWSSHAVLTALLIASVSRAADHLDGPKASVDPASDITDIFAWMS